jgi:hypothetical protein
MTSAGNVSFVFCAIQQMWYMSTSKAKKDKRDISCPILRPAVAWNHPPGTALNLVFFAYEQADGQL